MPKEEAATTDLVPIKRFGTGCLRQVAELADPGSAETADLLEQLWQVLEDDGGVGLAAPQIGVSLRVAVIRDPKRPPGQQRIDLVNPTIEKYFGEQESFEEGCLSFPDLYLDVMRPGGVRVAFLDGQGSRQEIRCQGLLARIVQHEVDHLDGVLFIDHLAWWGKFGIWPKLLFIILGKVLSEMRVPK